MANMLTHLSECPSRWPCLRDFFHSHTKKTKKTTRCTHRDKYPAKSSPSLKRATRSLSKIIESAITPQAGSIRVTPITLHSMADERDGLHEMERNISLIRKVREIQNFFARWPQGMRWERHHMEGIIEWCRIEFGLIPTRDSSDEHALMCQGAWRLVHALSPWSDRSEFNSLFHEPETDRHGRVLRDAKGHFAMRHRSPYGQMMEKEYLDLWTDVANSTPLPRSENGGLSVPELVQWCIRKLNHSYTIRDGAWSPRATFYEVVLLMEDT